MNRKLILLNVALAAVVAFAGVQLRKQWKAAKAREAAKLGVTVKTPPPPAYQSLAPQPAVTATGYYGIAQQMLFDRSRHPTVVEDPKPLPPPPPPMPALPVYHGMMNFGSDGPIALLSAGGTSQKGVRPGEQIGQFKLLAVNSEVISFEWNGQRVDRNTGDISPAANGIASAPQVSSGRTEGPAAPAAAPPSPLKGPGDDTGRGSRACNVNDGNATGAVVDGFRKVSFTSPFGVSCLWEPVR
jgi:hypothetical protein